jgi:hypothetical protein
VRIPEWVIDFIVNGFKIMGADVEEIPLNPPFTKGEKAGRTFRR